MSRLSLDRLDAGPDAPPDAGRVSLALVALVAFLAAAFHVAMEWLFFATKPSFLSTLQPSERLLSAGGAALPLLVAAPLAVVAVRLLATPLSPAARFAALRLVPAVILALTLFLLVDNFTHTLFDFGIETPVWGTRHLYAVLLLLLLWACHRWLGRLLPALAGESPADRRRRQALYALAAVVLLLSLAAVLKLRQAPIRLLTRSDLVERRDAPAERPNILLIGSDGLTASHLSLYGYRRPTSPFLSRFARQALVGERSFPNAANTGGSITSMLTGRLPTANRMYYPPDILRGESSYLHLPAALRQLGYRSAEISVRWYADAADLNLLDGFDEANSRTLPSPAADRRLAALGRVGGYFLARMGERVWERLVHCFTRRPWSDPYHEVTAQRSLARYDEQRLGLLFGFIDRQADGARRPWFAHVHLLGTHGARFEPRLRRYSHGMTQNADWMPDFYDDAVAGFDRYLQQVVAHLAARGELERTIIAIYSDHGMNFVTSVRVPLVVRFPGGAHAGRMAATTQNLDLAPTLLDAIGVDPPSWMQGRSLLRPGLDPCHWILSAGSDPRFHVQQGGWWVSVPRPPYYTLGTLSVVAGDRIFSLQMDSGRLTSQAVDLPPGGAGRCPTPDPAEARRFLLDHLRQQGYDVSPLAAGGAS